jgi:hypothetical protein
MSLRGDAPVVRAIEPPNAGEVLALPRVGGLHHRYSRSAWIVPLQFFVSTAVSPANRNRG